MAEIERKDDELQRLITKAIVDALTPEKREKLITDAILRLIEPQDRSQRGRSRLEQAFDVAIDRLCFEIASEHITKTPAVKDKIEQMFLEAWRKTTDGDEGKQVVSKIANAMSRAITGERY